MKTCTHCGEVKAYDEYYRHPKTADGRFPKCKVCTKKYQTKHRQANIDRVREVDRGRGNRKKYKTPERRKEYARIWHTRNPEAVKAHSIFKAAVASGKVAKPWYCERCWTTVDKLADLHGHHDDYSKPLDVVWLCRACHGKQHRK